MGKVGFLLVVSERGGNVVHEGVEGDIVEDKLEPADFTVDPINDHIVNKGLLESREVWLIIGVSGC